MLFLRFLLICLLSVTRSLICLLSVTRSKNQARQPKPDPDGAAQFGPVAAKTETVF